SRALSAMANFPIAPRRFLQLGMHLEDGGVRKNVVFYSYHPHGIGIFRLRDACQRDTLIALNPHHIGARQFDFVRHDEAPINFRRSPFARKSWIMLLGYPLDLKEEPIFRQVCAPFGQLLSWNPADQSLARVMLKVLIDDPLEVPRSLVIKIGREMDGEGRSWTVPVYMFNSYFADVAPPDEEDAPPHNGNPHPFVGPVVPGEAEFVQNMADQFVNQLANNNNQAQQNDPEPDQGSNAGSVHDAEAHSHSFTQGSAQSREVDIEQILPEAEVTVPAKPAPVTVNAQLVPYGPALPVNNPYNLLLGNREAHRALLSHMIFSSIKKLLPVCTVTFKDMQPQQFSVDMIMQSRFQFNLTPIGQATVVISSPNPSMVQKPACVIEEMDDVEEPVITVHNQIIKRRYFRKRIRPAYLQNPCKDIVTGGTLIFTPVEEEPCTQRTPVRKVISSKRPITPESVDKLRRSKRSKVQNDGYKVSLSEPKGPVTHSKSMCKVAPPASFTGKLLLPNICDSITFPDLAELDKLFEAKATHPEISVVELQRVATTRCGIPPEEVTSMLLLAPTSTPAGEGCSSGPTQQVING
ncbi:hypothetical protein EJB05_35141, partial [Eragrostis curvula]